MALRIGEYVVRGEMRNPHRYSTFGVLEFRGCDMGVRFELTGDPGEALKGKTIAFEARAHPMMPFAEVPKGDLRSIGFNPLQIGATGDMEIRRVRVADCTVEQLLAMTKLKDPPPIEWRPCLYLEWYSQNGRVVLELIDPVIEYLTGEEEEVPLPDLDPQTGFPHDATPEEIANTMPDIAIVKLDSEGVEEELFPGELEDQEFNEALGLGGDDPFADDDDGLKEAALLDDLMESDRGMPLASLFDKPMRLPREADIPDEQIEVVFKNLLAQLAMFNVAFHVCAHYTPRAAYKLLTEEILWEGESYRELRRSGWTMNFMTSEHCAERDREAEERYKEFELPPETE